MTQLEEELGFSTLKVTYNYAITNDSIRLLNQVSPKTPIAKEPTVVIFNEDRSEDAFPMGDIKGIVAHLKKTHKRSQKKND